MGDGASNSIETEEYTEKFKEIESSREWLLEFCFDRAKWENEHREHFWEFKPSDFEDFLNRHFGRLFAQHRFFEERNRERRREDSEFRAKWKKENEEAKMNRRKSKLERKQKIERLMQTNPEFRELMKEIRT